MPAITDSTVKGPQQHSEDHSNRLVMAALSTWLSRSECWDQLITSAPAAVATRRAACQVLVIYPWFWVNCSCSHDASCPSDQSDPHRRRFHNLMKMRSRGSRLSLTQEGGRMGQGRRRPHLACFPPGNHGCQSSLLAPQGARPEAQGLKSPRTSYPAPKPLAGGHGETLPPFPLPSPAPAQQAMQTPPSSADKPPTFF